MTDKYRDSLVKDLYELEVNCNICIEDLADDITEDCKKFYQQGRKDAIDEFIEKLPFSFDGKISESTVHHIAEHLKENKNND